MVSVLFTGGPLWSRTLFSLIPALLNSGLRRAPILLKGRLQRSNNRRIGENEAQFAVIVERIARNILRTHEGRTAIGDHHLGVHIQLRVLLDLRATGLDSRNASSVRLRGRRRSGQNYLDLDAALGRAHN